MSPAETSTSLAGRRTAQLLRQLERVPTEPTAAVRVLWLTDDPESSSDDLATVVSADPGLTSGIMRMANSAYYGLSGRVRSAAFAVTVLGYATVRSLAAVAAAGALEGGESLPPGFWLHAATTATAASVVAPRVGARHTEAFSLGLLHDLGRSLLHRADREGYVALSASAPGDDLELVQAEREHFGLDHVSAAARVLTAWRFPSDIVDALARHHEPPAGATAPLERSLLAGEALARLALNEEPGAEGEGEPAHVVTVEDEAEALALARIEPDAVDGLVNQVRRGGELLAASLGLAASASGDESDLPAAG